MEAAKLLKERKFWLASFLVVWAASLQGHMMWMRKQDAFKEKFGNSPNQEDESAQER
ncbi:hexose transporter [Wolffia australiana]